jgi:hypothetical protein
MNVRAIRHLLPYLAGVCSLTSLPACSSSDTSNVAQPASDSGGPPSGNGFDEQARSELIAVGLDKYFGKAKPLDPETRGTTKVYKFNIADGPECLRGGQYQVYVRDAASENLVIYLEGGGACWKTLCAANEAAESLNAGNIPAAGILSTDPAVSVVADWNLVYLPYCDGSVFSGDNEFPDETPPRYHHGLKNLSAGIDLAKSLYPNPKRIFLAGSSAGGYGTLSGTGVVRLQYPETELMVFNDSGLGLSNPQTPEMLAQIKADWHFEQFIPASCTECTTGQTTAIIGWGLQHDTSLRASAFSSYSDSVIAGAFLLMQPADFKALLLEETGKIHDAYPDRFKRFFPDSTQHTTLLTLGTKIGDVTAGDWTRAFVDKTDAWVDILQ